MTRKCRHRCAHRRYDSEPSITQKRKPGVTLRARVGVRGYITVRIYNHHETAHMKECVASETDPSKLFLAHDYVAV